jgi:histidinol-phosphate aminotransferase
VIFTKSFSKIHGLSALRIGYGFGNKTLIEIMNRVRQPFNVNTVAQKAAIESLSDQRYLKNSINRNTKERLYLYESLEIIGMDYIPSQGNFICIDTKKSAKDIFESLLQKGVIVRPIELYDMPNFIRVTIGNRTENNIFLEKFKEVLS